MRHDSEATPLTTTLLTSGRAPEREGVREISKDGLCMNIIRVGWAIYFKDLHFNSELKLKY